LLDDALTEEEASHRKIPVGEDHLNDISSQWKGMTMAEWKRKSLRLQSPKLSRHLECKTVIEDEEKGLKVDIELVAEPPLPVVKNHPKVGLEIAVPQQPLPVVYQMEND